MVVLTAPVASQVHTKILALNQLENAGMQVSWGYPSPEDEWVEADGHHWVENVKDTLAWGAELITSLFEDDPVKQQWNEIGKAWVRQLKWYARRRAVPAKYVDLIKPEHWASYTRGTGFPPLARDAFRREFGVVNEEPVQPLPVGERLGVYRAPDQEHARQAWLGEDEEEELLVYDENGAVQRAGEEEEEEDDDENEEEEVEEGEGQGNPETQ